MGTKFFSPKQPKSGTVRLGSSGHKAPSGKGVSFPKSKTTVVSK